MSGASPPGPKIGSPGRLLQMMTPTAPAATALAALSTNAQLPLSINAINPVKSFTASVHPSDVGSSASSISSKSPANSGSSTITDPKPPAAMS